MAGIAKFTMYQGSTFKREITASSSGTPMNLTDCEIRFKAVAPGASAVNVSTTSGHIVITDPTEGKFVLTITDEETSLYTWTAARYNIHIDFPNGEVLRLLEGKIKLSRRV
jgi:hypothetical protein